MNTPNYEYDWQRGAAIPDRVLFDEGLRQHMLRVYNYMGLGLVMTGLVAFIVGTTPALYVPIFSTPLKWFVMFAPLAFVLFGVLMQHAGFVPALLVLVVGSAAAGTEFKLVEVLVLAGLLTVLCVALFIWALGLPYPLFAGS